MRTGKTDRGGGLAGGRRLCAMALALTLAILATAGAPLTAKAVDLEKGCVLTIRPGSVEFTEDLTAEDEPAVVFDLYRVADLGSIPADGYRYQLLDDFQGMEIPMDADQEVWRSLAQEAARRVLLREASPTLPVVAGAEPLERIEKTDGEEDLRPGLYLVVARGTDMGGAYVDAESEERIVTLARTQNYNYTYEPELVALPAKESEEGQGNTADSGDWIYDLEIAMKPERETRFGELEIVKTLLTHQAWENHASGDPAVFVFSVEAALKGRTVYSDVVSFTFTEAGEQRILLDKIPVGATVTVTEVYSGASYEATTRTSQEAVIDATATASVRFENDYVPTPNGGGGIRNHFEYDQESGTWGWDRE